MGFISSLLFVSCLESFFELILPPSTVRWRELVSHILPYSELLSRYLELFLPPSTVPLEGVTPSYTSFLTYLKCFNTFC